MLIRVNHCGLFLVRQAWQRGYIILHLKHSVFMIAFIFVQLRRHSVVSVGGPLTVSMSALKRDGHSSEIGHLSLILLMCIPVLHWGGWCRDTGSTNHWRDTWKNKRQHVSSTWSGQSHPHEELKSSRVAVDTNMRILMMQRDISFSPVESHTCVEAMPQYNIRIATHGLVASQHAESHQATCRNIVYSA